ncbi:MAG TPA: hypothetical protein DEO54_05500 [Rikenellaceae bacterium]|nr:hypothetical protein [Rikenellaceae bacterium]
MSMHKIVLPVNLESVGYAAFSNCTNLGTINLPNGIKTISNAAFIACSGITGTLTLPTSLETIGNYAFSQCSSLESVTLPKTLKSIGFGAFHSCNLQFVNALMENPFPLINSFNNDGRKTLVVPKGKKEVYNSTSGWNNTNIFKKIVEMGESFEDYIRCDKKSLICYNEVNTASFKIESSSEWKIDSKPSWVTISKSTGNNGETINVSLSALSGVNFREGKIAVSLLTGAASTEITVYQHSLPFSDGSWIKLQGATIGSGVDLVFMGDGYTAADIFAGKYTADINNAISHFFDIEPYRSYRGYFNVYLVYGFSQESGISDLDNRVNTLFKTKFNDKTGTGMSADVDICKIYALKAPLRDISSTTVILIANSTRYAGTCIMFSYGFSVAICPAIQGIYPYDFRGLVQHEACGHGFGQLADEYVKYTGTIPALEVSNLRSLQSYGMFLNVDATNDRSVVLWRHFFNDPVYTYVGTFEGGLYYPQGIWRPESGSLMINNIRYINAPSREIIVKRIKRLAGEQFSFTEFRAKDRNELSAATKAGILMIDPTKFLAPPIIIKVP